MSKVLPTIWLGGGGGGGGGGGSFAAYWFKLITQKHLERGGNSD